MHRLGIVYSRGSKAVGEDPEKAFGWFLAAALQGIADAMYAVGICYRDGYGTDADEVESEKWIKLAADNGVDGSDFAET